MMLPLKYFIPMIAVGFGGLSAANQWSARESVYRGGEKTWVADSSNTLSITELPFPGYRGDG